MATSGWLTSEEIVRIIGGNRVSVWQIEKWRQKGLLPPHARKFLGKPFGSEAVVYPPETVTHVEHILKLKKIDHIRSLVDIQSWLWIDGFTIATTLVQDNLKKLAEDAQRFRVKRPEETVQRVEEISELPKLISKFGIPTAKSSDEVKSVIILLIKLFSGFAIKFDPETNEADYGTAVRLEKMLGLEEARNDDFPAIKSAGLQSAKPWLGGVPGDYIQRLSEMKLLSV